MLPPHKKISLNNKSLLQIVEETISYQSSDICLGFRFAGLYGMSNTKVGIIYINFMNRRTI